MYLHQILLLFISSYILLKQADYFSLYIILVSTETPIYTCSYLVWVRVSGFAMLIPVFVSSAAEESDVPEACLGAALAEPVTELHASSV